MSTKPMGFDTREASGYPEHFDDPDDANELIKDDMVNFLDGFLMFWGIIDGKDYGDALHVQDRINLFGIYITQRRGRL